MNIQNFTVTSTGDVHVLDSLNAALLELNIKRESNTTVPNTNDLIVYVDTQPSSNPSNNRKQYVFDLSSILNYYNQISDEFNLKINIENNDISFKAYVERKLGENNTILNNSTFEELDGIPLVLFEGENYIYTNYTGANITALYPKNSDETKLFLINSIYAGHRMNSSSDFCLDDIYFKDAFTKIGNELNIEINNISADCISSNNNNFSMDSNGNLSVKSLGVVNGVSASSITGNNNAFSIDSSGNITGSGSITGNALNIYSITSRNNGKFSMDSNGNLSVKGLSVNGVNITGNNGGLTTTEVVNLIYPVGSIYMSVSSTSPATLFGGTWVQLKDRFLLGAGDTYSNGNTGGSSSHTHTLGAGYTQANAYGNSLRFKEKTVSSWTYNAVRSFSSTSTGSGSQTYGWQLGGSTDSTTSLPPYLVVYMWKRTA